ncbi:trypsin-like peptidase domain-containing protein [Amycolatopsis sp. lyj-23]|uniref:trypsin-like peptidase domain-containing protein n=1 Tax=Amycolatopsis sp. lyj-23 TaxID=2789283 RepID=UPI0039795D1D
MWTGLIDHVTLYKALRLEATRFDKGTSKSLGSGHGTGFLVRVGVNGGRQRSLFLVTNRHVMDPAFGHDGPPRGQDEALTVSGYKQQPPGRGRYAHPRATKVKVLHPEVHFPGDSSVDLAVIRFDHELTEVVEGDGHFNTFTDDDIASPWVYDLGAVHAGTQVLTAGYPDFGGNRGEVTPPILIGGIVASDPRFPVELSEGVRPYSVLSHAFSKSGMSGGPVFAPVSEASMFGEHPDKFELRIVGVNAGHVHTGGDSAGVISHYVNSIALLELLADLGSDRAKFKLELERAFTSGEGAD